MSQFQDMVSRFNTAMKASGDANLRIKLIVEEGKETRKAAAEHDTVETVDGLCDLLYVTYGAADLFGITLDTEQDEARVVFKSPMGWKAIDANMDDFWETVVDAAEAIGTYTKDKNPGTLEDLKGWLTELAGGCWAMAAEGLGIDLRPFFEEVHRTNMLKLTGPKREDGKQLKPEGWKPPRISSMLRFLENQKRVGCTCTYSMGPIKDNEGGERCAGCAGFLFDLVPA